MSPVVAAFATSGIVLLSVIALFVRSVYRDDRLRHRIVEVQQAEQAGTGDGRGLSGLLTPVAALGSVIARSGFLSMRTLADLQRTLQAAGLRGGAGLSLFVGAKLLLLLGLPAAAVVAMQQWGWWPSFWLPLVGSLGIVGLLLPDFVVRRRHAAYLAALDHGLPDALDMLVICSEAGLGLEAAFERVSLEIGHGHPVIAGEMEATLQEMRINADRRAALLGLGIRTDLESLKRLGSTLVQTMQFGTPLSQALRTLSVELRQDMLTRFEARASRLPVLLTLPMIIFILPCVFLVVGGPAFVQVYQSFNQ